MEQAKVKGATRRWHPGILLVGLTVFGYGAWQLAVEYGYDGPVTERLVSVRDQWGPVVAPLLLVAAVAVAALWLVWRLWTHRHRVRAMILARLGDRVARETNTAPDELRWRRVVWEKYTPVAGWLEYSSVFRDDDPDARAAVEAIFTAKLGIPLVFTWVPPRDRMRWRKAKPGEVQPEPARDREAGIETRLQAGIESVLGCPISLTVNGWERDRPTTFTIGHPPSARVHEDRIQDLVEDKVAAMLHGEWRATWQTKIDSATFTDTPDPLRFIVDAGPLPQTCDLSALPMGRNEDGTPWRLKLHDPEKGVTHLYVAGATGAGKGSILWSLVWALHPAILDGRVQIWACDPKGGMELGRGRKLWTRYATNTDDIATLLEDAVRDMDARATRFGDTDVSCLSAPSRHDPLVVVLVDEMASLLNTTDKRLQGRILSSIRHTLNRGRAPGYSMVGLVQDPKKQTAVPRDDFPTRIALRVTDKSHPDMILGEGARAMGGRADKISVDTPGVCYIQTPGEAAPARARAFKVDDVHIRHMVTAKENQDATLAVGASVTPMRTRRRIVTVRCRDLEPGNRIILDELGMVEIDDKEPVGDGFDLSWRNDTGVGCWWRPADEIFERA